VSPQSLLSSSAPAVTTPAGKEKEEKKREVEWIAERISHPQEKKVVLSLSPLFLPPISESFGRVFLLFVCL
jgi:uncharacterized protein (UPF0216 family)